MQILTSRTHHLIVAAFLFFVCCITFFNSLDNAFLMDDHGLILKESRHHSLNFLKDLFRPVQNQSEQTSAGAYYRPLAHIPHTIAYHFFQDRPFGYHVMNLFLFYFSGLAVYALILRCGSGTLTALLTALLYLTHPINGLMVNYVTANVFSLQIIFIALGLMLGLNAFGRKFPSWPYIGMLGFFFLSLMCHETSLAFPFYLAACVFFVRKPDGKTLLKYFAPLLACFVFYMTFRMFFSSLKVSVLDKVLTSGVSPLEYISTFPKLMAWYVKCLLTGEGIVIIWTTPVKVSVGWILAGLMMVFGLLAIMWKGVKDVRLAAAWISASLLPVLLGCFYQIHFGFMIEPHWVIMAGIGFFLLIATCLTIVREKIQRSLWAVFVGILAFWCIQNSWVYNDLWGSEIRYCHHWLRQAPEFKHANFYLAGAYERMGLIHEAKTHYQRALYGGAHDFQVYNNLGLIAMNEKNSEAELYFQKALQLKPNSVEALTNLGIIRWDAGDFQTARDYFLESLDVNPYSLETRMNLASLLIQQGDLAGAAQLYEKNYAIDPTDIRNLEEALKVYLNIGDKNQVVRFTDLILKYSRDPVQLTRVGSLVAQRLFLREAADFFKKSLSLEPNLKDTYLEAGKLLGNMGRLDEAVRMWQDGQARFPREPVFRELIGEAQRIKSSLIP